MNKQGERAKMLLLGAVSLLLGVIFVWLFYKEQLGLNYPLFFIAVASLGLLLTRTFSRRITLEHYVIIGVGLFFSCMVFVHSSELLTFFNITGSILLLLIIIRALTGKHIRSFITSDYLGVILLPLQFIGPFFETFPAIISLRSITGGNTRTREIVRGSIMAVIAVFIFGWLFSAADAVFKKLLSHIFTFTIDQDIFNRIFIGAFVTAFFIGAFGFLFRKLHAASAPLPSSKDRTLGMIETMILFGSINVLFFIFIILQISSLFGGASHLITEGLTYAEYAREGFFQLVAIAILSFFIISFAEKQVVQNKDAHLRSFKILGGVLIVQVIAILISAFNRLSLYEDAYGFTTIRLYSHALMIWLGVTLALLALHILKNGKRADFSFRIFGTVIILLASMNLLNPDAFIAKKNLERYQSTRLLDADYLGSLSDDALPYTIDLLDDPNKEISMSFARELYYRDNNYCGIDDCTPNTPSRSWQSTRLNRAKADGLLFSRKGILEKSRDFIGTQNEIQE